MGSDGAQSPNAVSGTSAKTNLPLAASDDGTEPPLGDLLTDARGTEPVPASRLPAPPTKQVHSWCLGDGSTQQRAASLQRGSGQAQARHA